MIAQSIPAGATAGYKAHVQLMLGPKPKPPSGCRAPRYVRTVVNSPQLLAWENPQAEADSEAGYGERTQSYVACVPGQAKHQFYFEFSSLEGYQTLGDLQAAGHFIAFRSSDGSHYNSGSQGLVVYDVLRGSVAFSEEYPYAEEEPGDSVSALVLNTNGAVAWVKHEILWNREALRVKISGEHETLLVHDGNLTSSIETSASITHLALNGGLLQWESAGQTHSTMLP